MHPLDFAFEQFIIEYNCHKSKGDFTLGKGKLKDETTLLVQVFVLAGNAGIDFA